MFNNSELKGAPNMAKKRTKWSTNFFFSKEPYFWKKEHNFYPKTIFFYIFIHKFFWKCQNVAIFFGFYRWFLVFFKKFSKKVYFTVLQRSTKFFQRATRLWKSHQCATKRTLLNTLPFSPAPTRAWRSARPTSKECTDTQRIRRAMNFFFNLWPNFFLWNISQLRLLIDILFI